MGYMLPTEHKQAKLSPSSAKASLVLVLTLNRLFWAPAAPIPEREWGGGESWLNPDPATNLADYEHF